jgi:hypothetical protein
MSVNKKERGQCFWIAKLPCGIFLRPQNEGIKKERKKSGRLKKKGRKQKNDRIHG